MKFFSKKTLKFENFSKEKNGKQKLFRIPKTIIQML